MDFYLINQKKNIMITLVMQLLKTGGVVKEDLVVDSVVQIFQTYLKISLEILEVVVEDLEEEVLITGGQI